MKYKFLIFFLQINASFYKHIPDPNSTIEGRRKPVITIAGLETEIDINTFRGGKAKIRCVAEIFNLYYSKSEEIIEEDRPRPRPSSVLGTRDSQSGNMYFSYNENNNLWNIIFNFLRSN